MKRKIIAVIAAVTMLNMLPLSAYAAKPDLFYDDFSGTSRTLKNG